MGSGQNQIPRVQKPSFSVQNTILRVQNSILRVQKSILRVQKSILRVQNSILRVQNSIKKYVFQTKIRFSNKNTFFISPSAKAEARHVNPEDKKKQKKCVPIFKRRFG